MISTTAWEVASSRVSRWFSARNRPGSSLPPETVARCALRGAAAPRVSASRAIVHSRIWDWYKPSRRSTAALLPRGAASYSATTRARYAAVNERRIGHRFYRAGRQMITGTGKAWTVATHETVSCHALTGDPGAPGCLNTA